MLAFILPQQGGLGVEKNTAIYLIKEYKWNQPKLHLPAVADTISSHKNVDYLLTESCFCHFFIISNITMLCGAHVFP